MAAFSLGKLDAICARLKSSQQSSLASGCSRGNDRAEEAKDVFSSSIRGVSKCATLEKNQRKEAEVATSHSNAKNKLRVFSSQEASQDGQRGIEAIEKVKVQSVASSASKLCFKDDSIIDKDKNTNNNNSAEATDYNNEIDVPFQSTTFHTADSTTNYSDSCVSSTTAEPVLCNENMTVSQARPTTTLGAGLRPPHSDPVYVVRNSPLRVHPLSSFSPAAALLPALGAVSNKNLSVERHENSSNQRSYDLIDTGRVGSSSPDGQVAVTDCHVNSAVTSTQSSPVKKVSRTTQLQPSNLNDRASSAPLYSSKPNPSFLSSPSSLPCSSAYFESCSGKERSSEACTVSENEGRLPPNREGRKRHMVSGNVSFTTKGDSLDVSLLPLEDCNIPVVSHTDNGHGKPSSQSSRSSMSHELSGRRKSRKPIKPQKQVTHTAFADLISEEEMPFGNPDLAIIKEENAALGDSSNLLDQRLGESKSDESVNTVSENYKFPSKKSSSPLDLTAVNSNGQSLIPPLAYGTSENTSVSANSVRRSLTSVPADTGVKSHFNDTLRHNINNSVKRRISQDVFDMNVPSVPQVETSDSIVLVDFANNTMKELLGIYGFDGQDSKGVNFNSLKNFRPDRLSQFSPVDSDKPSVLGSMKKSLEERPPTKKSKSKSINGGAFRKNVYTSLAHQASTSYNSSASTSSSDTQDAVTCVDTSLVPTARTVRYSFSKKSYTQKVLNSSDFTKYIKRYGTGADCGGKVCLDLGYRDHYHCLDCPQKVFIRKEETVRHYKWHKKRNDSLQHGFMRYSPMDDCSKKHGNCTHNGRQTHYHCVQGDCDKVYVSTSDVQMHANFHRKDSAIIQEGFQRFRATEDCGTTSCSFYGQRTTHFHCRRPQCNFTFKNKADMEKHKSYHQKDEVLSKDGFKKFMKYETCSFAGCRYSKISNHIHCIRLGCQYVLHSTAQLYSHKRKHERREFDHAYRTYRNLQQKVPAGSSHVGIKKEGHIVEKSLALSHHAPINRTKILPLPVSAVSNARLVPEMSVPAAGNDKKQGVHIGRSTPLSLISSGLRKPVLDGKFPLPGSLVLPGKGMSPFPHTQVTTGEILNLTRKGGVEAHKDKEESRQTLTLPVKLSGEAFRPNSAGGMKLVPKSELNPGSYVKQEAWTDTGCEQPSGSQEFSDQPEDLSMPKKESRATSVKDDCLKVDVSFKSEPDSDSLPQMSETFDDDDDDDDDDDEDDDDKDYGKVEEPRLVNTFIVVLEGDKLNDSLNLTVPKEDGRLPREVMARSDTGLGVMEKLASLAANTSMVKASVVVPEREKKVTATSHADIRDLQRSQLPQMLPQGPPRAILTSKGKVLGVHIPVRLLPERRERDESWKRYLIRYTANDACFSRCSCLYKDHYHCRTTGCQVVFKSKDGVRGHARFHELQDSITPLVYLHFKPGITCDIPQCQYQGKEEHFHCNWTNCQHIIPASAPAFSRLEHYRVHECATVTASKSRNNFPTSGSKIELDQIQKRRGRPPKYPKFDLPVVPKVHLTEKEILDSTLAFMHNKCSEDNRIVNGFKKFIASELCPDDQCIYKGKEHFHCGRKYCHMSTDRLDVLNLHAKDFHNNITILDGYEFFERMVNCRRPVCHNNKINRHFHCMRPHCDYSFVRHSTMSQHNKKHPTVTSAVLSVPVTKTTATPGSKVVSASQFVPIAPAVAQTTSSSPPTSTAASPNCSKTVKSSGTFFPLSGVSSFKLNSLSSASVSSSQVVTSRTIGQIPSSTSLAHGGTAPAQLITGTQVFHAQDGTAIFPPGTLLTLPHNLISAPIPLLGSSAHGQQTNLLTGIIPVEQLSQHGLATPLVSIAGGQLISQGHHLLQPSGGILGGSVFQVIQNPTTVTTLTTSTPAPISASSASNTAAAVASAGQPLTFLLHHQQQQLRDGASNSLNWASLKRTMHYSVDLNCGRPFCKLKKKDHYHCLDCNQAFSFSARLRAHISKHGFKFKKPEHKAKQFASAEFQADSTLAAKPMDLSLELDVSASRNKPKDACVVTNEGLLSSLNLQPSVFTSMVKHAEPPDTAHLSVTHMNGSANQETSQHHSSSEPMSSTCHQELRASSDIEDNDMEDGGISQMSNITESKHSDRCLDSPPLIIDDDVLDESSRESSLDASSSSLTLCLSLSRKSNRKRVAAKKDDFICTNNLLIPKPAKKKKMMWGVRNDSDLPDGFKRVRCGEDCGHVRCAYRQTVTHFHCVRADCGYGFSDKSRIIQHRIRHERLDALMGGEFQQYRASVTCDRADCEFDEKASHFHCLKCPYSCADSSKVPAHRKYHTKLDNISNNGFIKYSGSADCQTAACSYFRKQTHYHCTFPGCTHSVLGPSQMAPHKLKHAQHQAV